MRREFLTSVSVALWRPIAHAVADGYAECFAKRPGCFSNDETDALSNAWMAKMQHILVRQH